MTDLEVKILEAQDAYYNDEPIMTDEEFDALWDKLKKENPNSSLFNAVGKDESEFFPKENHIMNMNSLEKVNNETDFANWWNRRIGKEFAMVQYKLDGISIELQYDKGELQKAITRGNGKVGDDITKNVIRMNGFPEYVSVNFKFAARGEIILEKDVFERKYMPKGFANPRNMASGISKQKDSSGCEDLKILFYDMKAMENHLKLIGDTESSKINFLKKEGFSVVDTFNVSSKEEVLKLREEVTSKLREDLKYDIDGLVVKKDIYNEDDLNRARPQYQIAFKFDTVSAATKIIDIYWSVSGRNITPVALLEPIALEGAIVRRASLSNPNRIRDLKLRYNDVVLVSRRGQIIPYVESVLKTDKNNEKIPSALNVYTDKKGVDWPVIDEGTRLIIDDKNFPQIKKHRIKKWIEKLNVKGFGQALLNKLFDENWIDDISDLYTIDLNMYLKSTNLKKATQKAFNNLYNVKTVPLETFIAGFDIEDVGEKVVALAVKNGYNTFNKLKEVSITKLSEIDGIGPHRAKKLKEGILELQSEMFKVMNFIKIESNKDKNENIKMSIYGKTFCFTGSLESMKRKEAQELVESKGGESTSSVSKNLDFLVTNDPDSGSSKTKKAKSLGTKIISEDEFLRMVKE